MQVSRAKQRGAMAYLVLAILVTGCANVTTSSDNIQPIVDVIQQCGHNQCPQRVQTLGLLDVQFERAALYATAEDFYTNKLLNCIGVLVPEAVLSKLELFNHRLVRVSGTFDQLSPGNECGMIHLRVQTLALSEIGREVPRLENRLDKDRFEVNPDDVDIARLRSLAKNIVQALDHNIEGLRALVVPELRQAISSRGGKLAPRVRFFQENRHELFGEAVQPSSTAVDVIRERGTQGAVVVCVCKRAQCDVAHATSATSYQSVVDPYFCFSAIRSESEWLSDDPVFTRY
jgi:hypothetical protein